MVGARLKNRMNRVDMAAVGASHPINEKWYCHRLVLICFPLHSMFFWWLHSVICSYGNYFLMKISNSTQLSFDLWRCQFIQINDEVSTIAIYQKNELLWSWPLNRHWIEAPKTLSFSLFSTSWNKKTIFGRKQFSFLTILRELNTFFPFFSVACETA